MHKRAWAVRAMHEAYCHEENSFLTLTYDPALVPSDYGLHHDHFQRFMKRLRKKLHPKKVRYLMCGEYGDKGDRPHYHCLLFGHDFREDRILWRDTKYPLYRSPTLDQVWSNGYASIGAVNERTAQYVAGYITKKVRGDALEEINPVTGLKPYELFDDQTGLILRRAPEYAKMSRSPGLGTGFYELFGEDIRRDDYVFLDGQRVRVPDYYDGLSESWDAAKHESNRMERRRQAKAARRGLTPERARAKEDYARALMRKGAYDNLVT